MCIAHTTLVAEKAALHAAMLVRELVLKAPRYPIANGLTLAAAAHSVTRIATTVSGVI
jgi:hypothetical protein